MTRKIIWTFSVLFILVSCEKDMTLDTADLQGTWTEQTNNSVKSKLIFENETLYFIKPSYTDTLTFRLDKKKELIFLALKFNPSSGESNHKISLNRKSEELSIRGLFPSIPEQVIETKFKKE